MDLYNTYSYMDLPAKGIIIGVDIGGTKIQAGAIDKEGTIVCNPVTSETIGDDKSENIFNRIAGTMELVIKNSGILPSDIMGIGMGVTGPLDTELGTILECPQLPTMHFFPLRENREIQAAGCYG